MIGGKERFVRTIKLALLQRIMKTKTKKPPKCCHPNCFECPYVDCRYDRLEVEDFTETNNRDYSLYEDSTGEKLHKRTDKEYRNARQTAYQRKNRKYVDRHEYNQKYYVEHGEEIKERMRKEYDTKKNTVKCRKYARKHRKQRKEYYREYYLKNREKKLEIAKEQYKNKTKCIGKETRESTNHV